MGQKAAHDAEPDIRQSAESAESEKKKLDLSAAQVAGSSLATVAAALLASKMGVYGTILGAGVVSVVATAGGPVIQHLFRRTGDQLRESARPKSRQAPAPVPDGEFGEATVHGTRVRGWKRTAVAAGAAFAISLGVLGTYEAVAGTSVSSGGGTIFSGGTRKAGQERRDPADESGTGGGKRSGEDGRGKDPKEGRNPDSGSPPNPSGGADGSGQGPSPEPSPDPSRSESGKPTPAPTPTPSTPSTPATTPAPSRTPVAEPSPQTGQGKQGATP
ncbi:hypothetical protein ACFV9E_38350 [Streptomyces sp. NPDC059835]|uniref:hypothetical protein n=1 Tax=Streptomyces sp. NPDC059835 TaxID=3346967 RepID=UPI00365E01B1